MTEYTIKPFHGSDPEYAALAEVDTEVFPDHPVTPGEIRYDDESFDRGTYRRERYLAWPPSGKLAGYCTYSHMESRYHPQRYALWGAVRPGWQGKGFGRVLFDRALGELKELEARWIQSSARENMPRSVRFLRDRGFDEVLRSWESHLHVQDFDQSRFPNYEARMQSQGITITTLAQLRAGGEYQLEDLYELHTTLLADVPATTPYTRPPLETFVRHNIESPESLPDGYFIALHGQRLVGESVLFRSLAQPESLYQGLTAVRGEYRGQGIAMALKLATIDYAQKNNFQLIKTWNATVNERMLAINDRLGFVRQPAWIEMVLELPETE